MKKYLCLLSLLIGFLSNSFSQDSLYTHYILNTLTSPAYNGRGYVKNGDTKAAAFLKKEFMKNGLQKIGNSYTQNFSFPVNTFPGNMQVICNEQELIPGKDYIVDPSSAGLKGEYNLQRISRITAESIQEIPEGTALLLDTGGIKEHDLLTMLMKAKKHIPLVLFIREKKLTWSVSEEVFPFAVLEVLRKSLPADVKKLKVNISEKFIREHRTCNVLGYLPGSQKPDSFLVVTAHYDHLGRMGKETYFPGANDNASGVSMLLNMEQYFSDPVHKPKYSILFIAFAGEEAGLLGSKWFTENPLIDLNSIHFLLNLDLLGTGDDGIMVVNGEILPQAFALLDSINTANQFVKTVGKRGKAHNSDHYYFTEKGVPAFFVYTLGGIAAYHDIYDQAATLPLTKYKEVLALLTRFLSIE